MISVLIPLYNKAESIENTIRCVQQQSYKEWEIVVVEGHSTDGSLEIIKRLAKEDNRISVFMQENRKGVTPARNESVLHAKYNLLAFLDADDYWEPDYLQNMVNLINDFPDAGIWGMNYGIIKNGIKQDNATQYNGLRGVIENPWIKGNPYWTSAIVISREAFDRVGGFDNRIIYGEDIDLWYRIMLTCTCVYEDKVLSYYRLDAENRACNHVFPLQIHIPFYIDKYKKYRDENVDFRRFFDLMMLYRLYPYCFEKKYMKDIKKLLAQIDFSLQKRSMKLRFSFPFLYKLVRFIRGLREEKLEEYQGGSSLK